MLLFWCAISFAVSPDGLTAYFPFNGNANDASGNGNHAQIVSASLTADRCNTPGSAYRLYHATFDHMIVSNKTNFDFDRTDSFSIAAWINPLESTPGSIIISKELWGSTGWLLVEFSGKINMYLTAHWEFGQAIQVGTVAAIPSGEWHHIAMTYDGSGCASGVRLYIDGERASTITSVDNLAYSILTDAEVWIGGRAQSSWDGSSYDGSIDELAIYRRTLPDREIRALAGHLAIEGNAPTNLYYDAPMNIVSGLMSELRADAGFARGICLGTFSQSPAADPLSNPPLGDVRYYLARGSSSGSCFSYGNSTLIPDPRDALDANDPCP